MVCKQDLSYVGLKEKKRNSREDAKMWLCFNPNDEKQLVCCLFKILAIMKKYRNGNKWI